MEDGSRFTQIRLENWRNFAHADVALQQRVFLVGPNASGKSNFLDAFRFLRDLVSVGGGFQAAIRKRGGVSSIRCYAARRYPEVKIAVGVGTTEKPAAWSYELHFSQDNNQRPEIKREVVKKDGNILLERPEEPDRVDMKRLGQTHLEQLYANERFRDLADFFRVVRYYHIVPHLVRDPDRSLGKHDDPFGGDFLEQIARTPERTRNSRLRRIGQALRVAVPQLKELKLTHDPRGVPHLRAKYLHWRAQGAWQNEDQFSDGTLRLMGLLWAVLSGAGTLLLEEPELSLHPEVVKHIPQMLARIQRRYRSQVVISTHSADLLNDPGIGMDEVLLLSPEMEGTEVKLASDVHEIVALLNGNMRLSEIVIPRTRPKDANRLALFEG
ncbi:MAG: AAA family ATPase [Candidatus Binataceae bacterium]